MRTAPWTVLTSVTGTGTNSPAPTESPPFLSRRQLYGGWSAFFGVPGDVRFERKSNPSVKPRGTSSAQWAHDRPARVRPQFVIHGRSATPGDSELQ